jgi:hypothetical protein
MHGKVEDHRKIDIRGWAREGLLTPGVTFDWHWNEDNQCVSSIGVRVKAADHLTLQYRWQPSGTDWLNEAVTVCLVRTACNYSGSRQWFICPCCARRVAVLYMASGKWACRHSLNLTYTSQSLNRFDRLHRNKMRIDFKLNAGGGCRPKGMHEKTYRRLRVASIYNEMALDDEFEAGAQRILRHLR